MSKRAVILAGGKGMRLRPYTVALPKPLMPVGEYPILEIIVRQLKYYGFTHITLAVNHQADVIKAYFQDGSKWGVRIEYSLETKPLSTMGPLKLINDLPSHFLVMNGDVLTDVDYGDFFRAHTENDKMFTILAHSRHDIVDYGVLKTNETSSLVGFDEKPTNSYLVSMGIYAVSLRVLDYIPEDEPFGFDNLMQTFLGSNVDVFVCSHDGYWMDIGRPDDYIQASDDFESMKNTFKIEG